MQEVTKYYHGSKKPAVEKLSLVINPGEVYGFLGSNGAGKSTTIRLLMDFLRPTSGSIRFFGSETDAHVTNVRAHIGYLPGDVSLPKKVTGRELLTHLATLQGSAFDTQYYKELTERFEAQLDKRTDTLSKGNWQKIGLIQAFMHKPRLLILDEPTSGLDPLMQEQFYICINEAKQRGAAIFLSSHSLGEVEKICDRIGIIKEGCLVYEGLIAEVIKNRKPTWSIRLEKISDIALLKNSPHFTILRETKNEVIVQPTLPLTKALGELSKLSVVAMDIQHADLEDEFMHYYETRKQS